MKAENRLVGGEYQITPCYLDSRKMLLENRVGRGLPVSSMKEKGLMKKLFQFFYEISTFSPSMEDSSFGS